MKSVKLYKCDIDDTMILLRFRRNQRYPGKDDRSERFAFGKIQDIFVFSER